MFRTKGMGSEAIRRGRRGWRKYAEAATGDEAEGGRRRGQAPSTKVRGGEEGSLWKKRRLTRRRSASEKAEKGEREKAKGGGGEGERREEARGDPRLLGSSREPGKEKGGK